MPTVSVAMATHNGARFLQEQLDSIATQTRQPDELVVCDDHSSDATWDILRAFAMSADFSVRLYRNSSALGCARNFDRVLSLADGEVIFLSDQDDFWFEHKIESMMSFFDRHPDVLSVCCDQELSDESLTPSGRTTMSQTADLGLKTDEIDSGCCTAFRSSIKPVLLPLPVDDFTHDAWLLSLTSALGARRNLPDVLQYRRNHANNFSACILNTPERYTRFYFARLQWLRRPDSGYLERLSQLDTLITRLEENETTLQLVAGRKPVSIAIAEVSRKRRALERRREMLGSATPKRFWAAVTLARQGDYRYFQGWKSFITDIAGLR